jgi:WD40 repeat protein
MLAGPALYGQGPSADWRAVATPHFRIYYPREYEEWALRVARNIESIRDEVSKEVGFTPEQTIDVLVMNPIAEANGSAWTVLGAPRIVFFAEPPGPEEQIGAYGHWIDLLAVHETTHIVHMLRPSRNALERLLPVDPITLRAPRWVLEGYATVVEGRLTGAGRPNSTIRALILRRWAQEGRLPSYGQLNSDQRFLGMSMAYLMGSAFLEWLEERSGRESLRNLWLRMTARQRRSFDGAFAGVFGESAERLYGRFLAELTASSMTIERAGELREGELFQDTPRASGSPAVSPDGLRLAVVLRSRKEPQQLVVWSTGPAEEEEKKFAERIGKILARDPLDVAPVRTKPLPRKALHTLVMPDGGDIDAPRWTRDGKSIVFAHRMPDANGDLHFDLFQWDFAKVTRVTKLADVRDADPFPDGRTAVAVRNRFGASQLVTIDLASGEITARTPPSIDVVETHPRVSPDGRRVAHVAHREGRWTLFIDDAPTPLDGDAAAPEWTPDGDVVLTLFSRGFAELHSLRTGTITRTRGGAFEPAPSIDGRLFFMSLDPNGYVVRAIPSIAAAPPLPALDASLAPAIPPERTAGVLAGWASGVSPLGAAARDAATPAGGTPAVRVGRLEPYWFAGGHYAPGDHAFEAGIRLGDVLGRLDALFIGSNDGGAVAAAWRGWPIEIDAHGFVQRDRGSQIADRRSERASTSCDPRSAICDPQNGIELRAHYQRQFPRSRLSLDAGVNDFVFADALFTTRQILGTTRLDETIRVELDESHYRGIAAFGYRSRALRLAARIQYDGGDAVSLGGIASSILPRSSYSRRVLDPALPVAILAGEEYDGWRIETSVPSMPFTAFYQRHDLDDVALSLAGLRFELNSDPNPILRLPGLDLTLGAARILEGSLRGDTKWWLGMRWHP